MQNSASVRALMLACVCVYAVVAGPLYLDPWYSVKSALMGTTMLQGKPMITLQHRPVDSRGSKPLL